MAGHQGFQKIAVGVEAIHDPLLVGSSRKDSWEASAMANATLNMRSPWSSPISRQINADFELETTRVCATNAVLLATAPSSERDDGIEHAVPQEIEAERKRCFMGAALELFHSRGAGHCHQAAGDDADVEEIRAVGIGLEGKGMARAIPSGPARNSAQRTRRVQVFLVTGSLMEVDQHCAA